ncbi:hypothetical protein BpHYR1_019832 [Brachionus plicatilis]|uniref:Uncharacterized protein n=1 Tax=Brachionus plicatilis TaxID=10195 RepID=A0A3M7QQH2_BRAPC|nr:hypothetical protein BpHYR1_019832 [Brachionus plicatilis]
MRIKSNYFTQNKVTKNISYYMMKVRIRLIQSNFISIFYCFGQSNMIKNNLQNLDMLILIISNCIFNSNKNTYHLYEFYENFTYQKDFLTFISAFAEKILIIESISYNPEEHSFLLFDI